MKKLYCFILLFCLFSCNEDELLSVVDSVNNEDSIDSEELKTRAGAGDGMYDLLGFSYDVTGAYLSVDEARLSVIDVAAFVEDYKGRFYDPSTTVGSTVFYAGATADDYINEINTKNSVTVGGNVAANAFSGSVTRKYESSSKYEYSTKYSFSHADLIKRVKRLYLDANVELLSKYLTVAFKQNLSSLSPDDFVKKYGTHVLTDISIGGRLQFSYRSSIVKESTREQKKAIVEGGVKFNIGKFGADINNSHEIESIKTLNKENASWNFEVKYIGGTNSGISLTFNSQTGYPSTSFDLKGWESSVNDRNSGLTDIAWDKAYPIYEFITDPVKKAQIKAAVSRYMKNKELEVLEIVPLYQFTTKGKYHYNTNSASLGWDNQGVTCYVHKNKDNDQLVPLYQFARNGSFHYNTEATSLSGWDNQGITCYVYKSKVNIDVTPLYQFAKKGQFHYGLNLTSLDWDNQGITCYVYK